MFSLRARCSHSSKRHVSVFSHVGMLQFCVLSGQEQQETQLVPKLVRDWLLFMSTIVMFSFLFC